MKLLIIGASGLIGSHVLAEARARNLDVCGTYRNYPITDLVKLDLGDLAATRRLFVEFRPDWVVHAAGWTWVDGCETDPGRAFRENCQQPAEVAKLCREFGCRFAYFSTTYVFDGTSGPYSETDTPNPINVYAKSKWAAEQSIQQILDGNALIPRVICVWGREAQRKNFAYQVLKALEEGRTMTLPSDQLGNPTWAGDIAWWLLELVTNGEAGVWNLAGEKQDCTRAEWFCHIRESAVALGLISNTAGAGYLENSTSRIGQGALRPLRAGAKTGKIQMFRPLRAAGPGQINVLMEVGS